MAFSTCEDESFDAIHAWVSQRLKHLPPVEAKWVARTAYFLIIGFMVTYALFAIGVVVAAFRTHDVEHGYLGSVTEAQAAFLLFLPAFPIYVDVRSIWVVRGRRCALPALGLVLVWIWLLVDLSTRWDVTGDGIMLCTMLSLNAIMSAAALFSIFRALLVVMSLPSSPRLELPIKECLAPGLVVIEYDEVNYGVLVSTKRKTLEVPTTFGYRDLPVLACEDLVEVVDFPLFGLEPVSRFDNCLGYFNLDGFSVFIMLIFVPLFGWMSVSMIEWQDSARRFTLSFVMVVWPLLMTLVSYWSFYTVKWPCTDVSYRPSYWSEEASETEAPGVIEEDGTNADTFGRGNVEIPLASSS